MATEVEPSLHHNSHLPSFIAPGELTRERLMEELHYAPETGQWCWIKPRRGRQL